MEKNGMGTDQTIRAEINELADFYGLDASAFMASLGDYAFDNYVELVLGECNFEVVLGGLQQEPTLAALARINGFPEELVQTFEACARRFPDKMIYTKFCPGTPQTAGSMYLVLVEPWDQALDFLHARSFPAVYLEALRQAVGNSGLCFILGFTYDLKNNELVVKTYHLFDRAESAAAAKPFLISQRLTREGLTGAPKSYRAKVNWDAFRTVPGFPAVAAFGAGLFGDRYAMLSGESPDGEVKAYVFRYDRRENAGYSLKTYNYYIEQGNKFLDLNQAEAALNAFRNAVDFDPNDAEALNRLGFAVMLSGKYIDGIELVLQARQMNPGISNIIWRWSNVPSGQEGEIERVTRAIAENPHPDLYHTRGILYFQRRDYEKAAADIRKTVEMAPLNAEAYNNLGGVYLKMGHFLESVKSCNIALSINRHASTSNLGIAREAMRLIRETEINPSEKAFIALGKYLYQIDLFEDARANFFKAAAFEQVLQA